jgi:hypothetical protein
MTSEVKSADSANSGLLMKAMLGPFIILVLAFYGYYLACCIDQAPSDQLGADFWPKMILIFLMVSCGIKFVEIYINRKDLAAEAASRPEMNNVKLTLMIVLLAATVVAIDVTGFAVGNLLFMLLFLYLAGMRKVVPLVAVSVIGTAVLVYVFAKIVYLPLPKGWGFFEDISLAIYRALFIL